MEFIEQVVKRETTKSIIAKKIIIILSAILIPIIVGSLAYVIEAYFIYIALFTVPVVIYLSWWLITSMALEYEYSVVEDVLSIDKVIAKRRRKSYLKINIKEIEKLELVNTNQLDNQKYSKVFMAADNINSETCYGLVYKSKKYGRSFVYFSPKKKILTAMRPYLKRELFYSDTFKNISN